MRRGFDGLAVQVRNILQLDPFSGALFLFREK
jgi:transposase